MLNNFSRLYNKINKIFNRCSLHDLKMTKEMHYNCRNNIYPRSEVKRFPVPDEKVSWNVVFEGYNPPLYTAPGVIGKPWTDSDIGSDGFKPDWNSNNGTVNRVCGTRKYEIDEYGYPVNPVGRTGLKGRGTLGRWGPNCAGDAIVTRWTRDNVTKEKVYSEISGKPLLQFISIKRKDCGEWALPGGFADSNEEAIKTVRREFLEEALDSLSQDKIKDEVLLQVDKIFSNCKTVYSGYVDDRRNTDQAWITTVAINCHDETGSVLNDLKLSAGDDAGDVKWHDVDSCIKLYASHKDFIAETAKILGAHF